MTNAPWILRGRAVTAACLTLSLAAPVPAALAATPSGPSLATILERDAHRSKALLPARRELARKRAERARLAAGGKPQVKPPADRKDKAPADWAAHNGIATTAAKAAPAAAPAKARPAAPAATTPTDAEPAAKAAPEAAEPKAADKYGEDTKLDLPTDVEAGPTQATEGSGGSVGRALFGLLVVVGLIYGLTAALRKMRAGALGTAGKGTGGLKAVASIPLGPNRSIHLVRAGQEYLLVGAAEHGVVPLRTYTEDEARAAGLLDLDPKRATAATTSAAVVAEQAAPAPAARPWDGLSIATLVDDLREKTVRR